MNILGAADGVSNLVSGVMDRFWPKEMSEKERAEAAAALTSSVEGFIAQREGNQRDVMVEELRQGDNYTKRARPTIVYAGLAFIALVHVLLPMIGWGWVMWKGVEMPPVPKLELPVEFWWAWSGVCGVYAIGRSMEKRSGVDPVSAAVGVLQGKRR